MDFLGLAFRKLVLEQRDELTPLLERHPQPLSGYTFASLLIWGAVFDYHVALPDPDTLLVSGEVAPGRYLLQPVGSFPAAAEQAVIEGGRRLAWPLRIVGVGAPFLAAHAACAAAFEVTERREGANYIYNASALAELPGRAYAAKRNLIAQARRLYEWSAEPLTADHVADCLAIADDIAAKRDAAENGVTLERETVALEFTLRHFGALGLHGVLVRVGGQPAAFSIYERSAPDTAVILFERAVRSYKGLYQVVNRETARVLAAAGFTYINREEDLGDPGLRRAKLSYNPLRLEMGYAMRLRGSP
ncbi:MAG TPA: phosphatidylglycerol lysyltransferase domain-containing protein [Polyangia bacterium]|jgi:hypothetical protein